MPTTTHTLSNGTLTATLPADLLWTDEYASAPVRSNVTQTLDGGAIVEQSLWVKGRPVTLEGADDHGWLAKSELDTLMTIIGTPGALTLTLADDRVLSVVVAPGEAIKARPIWPTAFPQAGDWYVITLSLIQV
jgi:hypothetical protein